MYKRQTNYCISGIQNIQWPKFTQHKCPLAQESTNNSLPQWHNHVVCFVIFGKFLIELHFKAQKQMDGTGPRAVRY